MSVTLKKLKTLNRLLDERIVESREKKEIKKRQEQKVSSDDL